MNKIKHTGIVDGVEGECVKVRILQASACSACKVAAHCNASEMKEKMVEIRMTLLLIRRAILLSWWLTLP